MQKIRVGVVRGGPSSEYDFSLETGESVLAALRGDKYAPIDILLTKNGEWYMNGIQTDLGHIATHVDVLFNALHGSFGEDGKVQKLFEHFGIPFTGSTSLPSAIGMHKGMAKDRFAAAGLLIAGGDVLSRELPPVNNSMLISREPRYPLIVKPVSGGSSVATAMVHSDLELIRAIATAQSHGDILVEEVIIGKEASVCVVEAGDAQEYFVLFPTEVFAPIRGKITDHEKTHLAAGQSVCPGAFTLATHVELRNQAVRAHQAIGARHYSQTDFIIADDGIYVLEINTLPSLSGRSLMTQALEKSGIELHEFLDHVLGLALASAKR